MPNYIGNNAELVRAIRQVQSTLPRLDARDEADRETNRKLNTILNKLAGNEELNKLSGSEFGPSDFLVLESIYAQNPKAFQGLDGFAEEITQAAQMVREMIRVNGSVGEYGVKALFSDQTLNVFRASIPFKTQEGRFRSFEAFTAEVLRTNNLSVLFKTLAHLSLVARNPKFLESAGALRLAPLVVLQRIAEVASSYPAYAEFHEVALEVADKPLSEMVDLLRFPEVLTINRAMVKSWRPDNPLAANQFVQLIHKLDAEYGFHFQNTVGRRGQYVGSHINLLRATVEQIMELQKVAQVSEALISEAEATLEQARARDKNFISLESVRQKRGLQTQGVQGARIRFESDQERAERSRAPEGGASVNERPVDITRIESKPPRSERRKELKGVTAK